jgi:NitT/TauT family transport system ATP-binding protein
MNREPSGVLAPGTLDTDAAAAGSDAACLRVASASVRYGALEVLRDVSFEISANEIVSIVGRSGCGKTTLLRCIAGLLPLDQGSVEFENRLVDRPLEGVCMVFQHFGLLPWKNVWNNIAYGLRLRRTPNEVVQRRVAEAVDMVGLRGFEKAFTHQLSGGMQQRTGLARALVMQPRLLLMDEPFSSLDAQTREVLQFELLRIWDRRHTAMLFVTHSIDEAVLMADRVVVLGDRPASVRSVLEVDLPRPRTRQVLGSSRFHQIRDHLWRILFEHEDEVR